MGSAKLEKLLHRHAVPKASIRLNFIVCADVAVQFVFGISLARKILHCTPVLVSVRGCTAFLYFISQFLSGLAFRDSVKFSDP